ncbi:ABC transporter substrate-binding protein [Isoptericola aurantiacus]|uniref:ABC transporter substrate-binding protein n=1 Tax=Isoptericola aurantiacus TaxID=3377839 RepID=UPI00383AA23F
MNSTTRTRRRAAGAVVAAAALVLTGCSGGTGSGGADGDVTLTFAWWGDASRADRYEQVIALYEDQNPGVTIQSSYGGWGDYWTARNTEAAGGSLPDVFQMDVAYLRQYGASGQIQPLDDYLGDTIDISSFPESILPATQIDGQTFGVPTQTTTFGTFFNDDLLAEIGVEPPTEAQTWDEYDAFLSEVGAAGADHDPAVSGSNQYTQIWSVFEIWLLQQGKSLYGPDGGLGFTEADLTAWWERATPLFEDGGFLAPDRAESLESDALSARYSASEISFYNFLVRFSEGSGGDEFSMVMPPADSADQRGLYLKPGLQLSMSAQSEHPEEAAEFIDFITNDPQVGEIFGMSRGVPTSESARDAVQAEGMDAEILEYWEQVEEIAIDAPAPPPEGAGSVEAEFTRIAQDIAFGATTLDEGVELFFTNAADLME